MKGGYWNKVRDEDTLGGEEQDKGNKERIVLSRSFALRRCGSWKKKKESKDRVNISCSIKGLVTRWNKKRDKKGYL